jgi:hypothetical protein
MTEQTQAQRDAQTAWSYAVNCVMAEERPQRIGRTPAEVFDDYATDVGDQLGGDRDRLLAAARAACIAAAEEVGYPGRWRSAIRAVELCQRAAAMAEAAASPA